MSPDNDPPPTTFVDRAEAVRTIAGHLADRDAFVVTAPPSIIENLSRRLTDVPAWSAYVDSAHGESSPRYPTERGTRMNRTTMTNEGTAAFAAILSAGVGNQPAPAPAEPPGPRAPRPDRSQGLGLTVHVDTRAEALARFAAAIQAVPPGAGDGGWREVL